MPYVSKSSLYRTAETLFPKAGLIDLVLLRMLGEGRDRGGMGVIVRGGIGILDSTLR